MVGTEGIATRILADVLVSCFATCRGLRGASGRIATRPGGVYLAMIGLQLIVPEAVRQHLDEGVRSHRRSEREGLRLLVPSSREVKGGGGVSCGRSVYAAGRQGSV
jgi:hypothetical protein